VLLGGELIDRISFGDCMLLGADLTDADLKGVTLTDVILREAVLADVSIDGSTKCQSLAEGYPNDGTV